MLFCLGEPLVRLLCCCCSFLMCILICQYSSCCSCSSSFISRLLYHVTGTTPWLLRPAKASTSSELYPNYFWLRFLLWAFYTYRRFLPYAPSQNFWHILLLSRLPWEGSRQFFLEICRASYWSLKHRPGASVCLVHSNPHSFICLKFVFIHINIAKVFTCGENFDKKYRSAATLFSSHENIKQQPN